MKLKDAKVAFTVDGKSGGVYSFSRQRDGPGGKRENKMITLVDTFNGNHISKHRTVLAAVKSQRKHLAAVRRANGSNSYLTYAFRRADGTPVDGDEITQAQMDLDNARSCPRHAPRLRLGRSRRQAL